MKKMSFSNIKDVLSRDEMKMIMAGSGGGSGDYRYSCMNANHEWLGTLEVNDCEAAGPVMVDECKKSWSATENVSCYLGV